MIRISFIVFLIALSGCQSTVNGDFSTVKAEAPPGDLAGNWSGNVGPFKANFKIDRDGTGLFCYSRGKLNKVEKVKYYNDVIYTQRKTSVIIKKLNEKIMKFDVGNFGIVKYEFEKDAKLKKASRYCQGRLRW